jgi:hypothetical protein
LPTSLAWKPWRQGNGAVNHICGQGVTVFDKTGKQTERIAVAEP